MTQKKGLPPLAYAGIGCLVIALVGVITLSLLVAKCKNTVEDYASNPEKLAAKMAELAIKNDPDLEFVSTDNDNRTITYRDKKSGKETTISWENAKDGKLTVTSGEEKTTLDGKAGSATIETPEGTTTVNSGGGLEKFPKWIEVPAEVTGWKSAMRTEKGDGTFNGSVSGTSKASVEELAGLFEKALEAAGFAKVTKTEAQGHALLGYEDQPTKRHLSVTIFQSEAGSMVNLGYSQK